VFDALRQILRSEQVVSDLRSVLEEAGWHIELDGKRVNVTTDRFDVLARSCHTYDRDMSFGDHYRVLVAIGGVRGMAHGVPEAEICFATLWYSPALALITTDFSAALP
jgi:hypothetical protein